MTAPLLTNDEIEGFRMLIEFRDKKNSDLADKVCAQARLANSRQPDKIVAEIINDLSDRSGLGNAWDGVDRETRNEIIAKWRSIVLQLPEPPGGETK